MFEFLIMNLELIKLQEKASQHIKKEKGKINMDSIDAIQKLYKK